MLLGKLLAECFPPEFVQLVDGGHDTADLCLAERFDKLFYTGSPRVGTYVLTKAAKNLTPTALELGGETGNWCIVRADANLKDAARKIAFFKALNSGQICININQVAVAEEVAEPFLRELRAAFEKQLGADALQNPEYPRLISEAVYDKCAGTAERYRDRIVFGGCINEVCLHMMVRGVPFNGVGHSGMGAYHGRWGFREFTHPSTVLIGSTHLNLPLREHPYGGRGGRLKLFFIERFER